MEKTLNGAATLENWKSKNKFRNLCMYIVGADLGFVKALAVTLFEKRYF